MYVSPPLQPKSCILLKKLIFLYLIRVPRNPAGG